MLKNFKSEIATAVNKCDVIIQRTTVSTFLKFTVTEMSAGFVSVDAYSKF